MMPLRDTHVVAARGLVLLALLVLTPAAAAAQGTIQLTVTTRASLVPRGLHLEVELRNDGDAPALNVMPFVVFRGSDALGTFVPVLQPSSTTSQTIAIDVPEAEHLRGVFPIFVRVSYSDAGNHGFDALHVATVPFGDGLGAPVLQMQLSGARVETTGEVTARLESAVRANVSLTFLTAAGLAITPEEAALSIDPSNRRRIAAIVTNAGATPSSRLPVFAVAQYDAGNGHETAVASAIVEIAAEGSGETARLVLAALLAALLVTWALVAFVRRPRRAE